MGSGLSSKQGEGSNPLIFALFKMHLLMLYIIPTNSQKNRQIIQQYIVIYNILKYNRIMVMVYKSIENMEL